jgi:hypothetical protein
LEFLAGPEAENQIGPSGVNPRAGILSYFAQKLANFMQPGGAGCADREPR